MCKSDPNVIRVLILCMDLTLLRTAPPPGDLAKSFFFFLNWVKSDLIRSWMSRKAQDGQDIKEMSGDFPGGPVVGTLCFLCSGYGSIPGQGPEISQATWFSQKKERKNLSWLLNFLAPLTFYAQGQCLTCLFWVSVLHIFQISIPSPFPLPLVTLKST